MSLPNRLALCSLAGALGLVAGCAAPAAEPAPAAGGAVVQVFKSRGALQCAGRGTPPDVMADALRRAGIAVLASGCGSVGRLRPAVCGAGTDELNLFDISAADLARAQALGFAPLAQLPGAGPAPCR